MASGARTFPIHADDAGRRLDRILRRLLPEIPLAEIFRLLRKGAVRVDGARVEPGFRPAQGARISLPPMLATSVRVVRPEEVPRARPGETQPPRPEGPPCAVVFEDGHLLVVDKPPGLAVQPGAPGTADAEDHVMARCSAAVARAPELRAAAGPEAGGSGGDGGASPTTSAFRPAPVHRLDRGTSGLLVIGTSGPGQRGMVAAFRERKVEKRYLAVVRTADLGGARGGTVDLPITVEAARGRGRRARIDERGGKPARTVWRVLEERADGTSLLEVDLGAGGRTHQIRVHLAAVGAPLVGDAKYGGRRTGGRRPLLHAWTLGFEHPVTGARLDLEVPPPADMGVGRRPRRG